MKKLLCCLVAVTLLLGCMLTGCGGEDKTGGRKVEGKYLVEDGKANYVLVIPNDAQKYVAMAAEEFTFFIELATGCTMNTCTEDNIPAGMKFISLGQTKQFFDAFSEKELDKAADTFSAYFIASSNDNIYIAGGENHRGQSVLYGVYDLLSDMIGYTYYYVDEIAYTESDSVNLWSYAPQTRTASFDMRTHSTRFIYNASHEPHGTRLRYINFSQGLEWDALTSGHSSIPKYLAPRDVDENGVRYGDSHPEWFVDPTNNNVNLNENQWCWSAGGDADSLDEMQTLIADKLVTYAQMDQEATFFMIGQMDNSVICQCDGCKQAIAQWAGTAAGLQVNFINGVIEKAEPQLKKLFPDREIYIAYYAYQPTFNPPVKLNDKGEYEPYSDKVLVHEMARIFYAPVTMNYGFPFDSPYNKDAYEALKGWDTVCNADQLMVYTYDLNIRLYYANFYNLGTIASHMQTYQKHGVSYLLSQGVSDTHTTCFDELRSYCISRLMWDSSLNFQELASDFITHYYREAAQAMQTYYDMIVEQNAWYLAMEDPGSGVATGITSNTTCYPRAFVEKLDAQIELAMEAISGLEQTEPEQYERMKARIMKEYLSNIYLKMVHYRDFYSETEIAEMRQIWDYYHEYWNITAGGEGYGVPDIFG